MDRTWRLLSIIGQAPARYRRFGLAPTLRQCWNVINDAELLIVGDDATTLCLLRGERELVEQRGMRAFE